MMTKYKLLTNSILLLYQNSKFKKLYSITDMGKSYFLSWLEKPIVFSKTKQEHLVYFYFYEYLPNEEWLSGKGYTNGDLARIDVQKDVLVAVLTQKSGTDNFKNIGKISKNSIYRILYQLRMALVM